MGVFYSNKHLPEFRNPVLTIGTFDGVHHGHRKILQEVVRHADEVNGESIVITFEPHPRKLLFPNESLRIITPLEEKLALISETGIQHVVVVPFTRAFSNLSAKDYIGRFIVGHFHPVHIVIGYDHHFGHDRTGSIRLLKELEPRFGYKVYEIPAQLIDEAAVSSTKIRHALTEGRAGEAAHMLGRPYSFKGKVIGGRRLGRTLGYPTANLQPLDTDQLIPARGIYAVRIRWGERLMGGMMSIGFNPTVTSEQVLHIEVHIFDFSEDIYAETLEVLLEEWIRPEEQFSSLEELKARLHQDQLEALRILS